MNGLHCTILALVLGLTACDSTRSTGAPAAQSAPDRALMPDLVLAQPEAHLGARVIWSGRVIADEKARLRLLSFRHNPELMPMPRQSHGPHVQVDLDPDRHRDRSEADLSGRWVTVLGTVMEETRWTLGTRDIRVPRLRAEAIHLWPRSMDRWPQSLPEFD